jgi:hypothetical protein
MYRGYKVNLTDLEDNGYIDVADYVNIGEQLHRKNKIDVKKKLESFKDSSGSLQASQIVAGWFPPIEADVFLSHSHEDEDKVFGLAGFLHTELGLSSFIDSGIWGYSDHLLRLLDDEYCYRESTKTYSYERRNRSTSHVHIMLSIALMKMIDGCECAMFVDTPNSISPKQYINDGDETGSPWIYSEISMTSLVRRRSLAEHRGSFAKSSRAMDSISEDLRIQYDVNLDHLIELTRSKFAAWEKCGMVGTGALDALYALERKNGY